MVRARPLPTHARIMLDQFVEYTGWHINSPAQLAGMQTALDFFQDKIPASDLRRPVSDPSPWALPRGGVIWLSELMQAIDFQRPVTRIILPKNTRLKAFLAQQVGKHDRPRGRYFTNISAQPATLGIPREQDREHLYNVEVSIEALKSTVSDAYADWVWKHTPEAKLRVDPHGQNTLWLYRAGGGTQLFLWDAERHLKHV